MASNPYYNFFNNKPEQDLIEDLSVESLRQFAHDVYYLPRTIDVKDEILTEPIVQTFDKALSADVYVKSWDSFEGQGQLLAKFGLEIREQMTLIMSKRTYEQYIKPITGKERPWEGDCIYIPMLKTVYQIKYANSTNASFYVLGKNYAWEIVCEILEFNNEQFATGVEEIDALNPPFEHADDPDYDLNNYDRTAQNDKIQEESNKIIDWSERNPFGDV